MSKHFFFYIVHWFMCEYFVNLYAEKYKVAFAASLGVPGNTGPFNTEVTLVFKNVFVNTDKVYNPTTGMWNLY